MILRENIPFRLPRFGLVTAALLAMMVASAFSQTTPVEENGTGPERGTAKLVIRPESVEGDRALPEPARKVRDRLHEETAAAKAELDRRMASQRQAAIEQLQTLADLYTATHRDREAAAVRQEIERISARPDQQDAEAVWPSGLLAAQSLASFRNSVGQSIPLIVTGTTTGTVWGTDIYTDDSSPGAAAVHAGLLKPGEQRAILVKFLKGQDEYLGSSRNGIDSSPYKHWEGSFSLEAMPDPKGRGNGPAPFVGTPNDLIQTYRGQDGAIVLAEVTGSTTQTIWGDNVYTDDSPLSAAAVHAGALQDGEKGLLRIAVRPARESYAGSTRNGMTSRPYGPFDGSFQILPPDAQADVTTLPAAPSLQSLRGKVGEVLYIKLTGSTAGMVWGVDTYTDDSSLPAAAVHAGALRDGELAIVKVTIAAPPQQYEASKRNGVTSQAWDTWDGCFRVERLPAGFVPKQLYSEPVNQSEVLGYQIYGGTDLSRRRAPRTSVITEPRR